MNTISTKRGTVLLHSLTWNDKSMCINGHIKFDQMMRPNQPTNQPTKQSVGWVFELKPLNMSFDISVEKVQGNSSTYFTVHGSRTLYEETYDGTRKRWLTTTTTMTMTMRTKITEREKKNPFSKLWPPHHTLLSPCLSSLKIRDGTSSETTSWRKVACSLVTFLSKENRETPGLE